MWMGGREEAGSSSRRQCRRKKKAKADMAHRSHGVSSRLLRSPWAKITISCIPCLPGVPRPALEFLVYSITDWENPWVVLAPRVPGHTSWDRLALAWPAVGNLRAALSWPAHYFLLKTAGDTCFGTSLWLSEPLQWLTPVKAHRWIQPSRLLN